MQSNYEVIIIGGSYAGLSAAMALGRASRNILVIDSGLPCNRHTPHSHNFITNDGKTPAQISKQAKSEVMAYPTVSFINDKAISAQKKGSIFGVGTQGGKTFSALKLLFATGLKDNMPAIENFEDCWAISVLHCPYCHGYEVKGQKTAIIGNDDAAMHFAALLLQWTKDLTAYTNGPATFKNEDYAKLKKHNIKIIEAPIKKLKHTKGYVEKIVLQDGSAHPVSVIYARPNLEQHCPLPQELGCAVDEHGFITVDMMQQTSVDGVYAAGDCTTMQRAVVVAAAAGMKAGAGINAALAFEAF